MSRYKFGNDLTKIRENKRISQKDLAFCLTSGAGLFLE